MKQIISFEKEIAFKTMIGEITSISLEHTLHFQNDSNITGDLIISGTYKMTEASTLEESFEYSLPVDIMLQSELEEQERLIAIDNFTYAVMNEEILKVDVDILVQGLEKIEILEVPEEIEEEKEEVVEEITLVDEVKEESEAEEKEEEKKGEEEEMLRETVQESMPDEKNTMQSEAEFMNSQEVVESLSMNTKSEKKEEEKVVDQHQDGAVMNSIFSLFANADETYSTYSVYILREEDNLEEVLSKYNITREELGFYNNLDEIRVGSKLIIPTTMKDA